MAEFNYKGINVKEYPGGILLSGVSDFIPTHVFQCGQCFRWQQVEEESFHGIAGGKQARISMLSNGDLELSGVTPEDLDSFWHNYLDLGTDYGKIKELVTDDDIMREAIEVGKGIRLLKQDLWEMMVSFIISANNNIPRISGSVEKICNQWGDPISGTDRKSFPTAKVLSQATVDEIRSMGVGFRDKYIKAASLEMQAEGSLEALRNELIQGDCQQALDRMLKFTGVGPKVAHCILLFTGIRYDMFPKDVWVLRVMKELYPEESNTPADIDRAVARRFGDLAGYAQQYLFYYIRKTTIGK